MDLLMFAIYDVKAEAYNSPFFLATNGLALRGFQDLVQDGRTTVAQHPGDYRLDKLGNFNVVTGEFVPDRISLGWGSDFVVKPEPLKAVN